MPLRTLNYTNRKRIARDHAQISVRQDKSGHVFNADLHLGRYDLPGDALVYVEAYRQTQYTRFEFGRVGALKKRHDCYLSDFDSVEGVLYRVKVVTSTNPHGLLLAEADQIRPRKPDDANGNRIPLLPVVPDSNLGDEVWSVEYDGHQACLKVNKDLGDWRAIARHPAFSALVYPAVFRSVLSRILIQEDHREADDIDDWRCQWLRFTQDLPGIGEPPSKRDEELDEEWIDDAVKAFSRRFEISVRFKGFWTEVGE